MIYTDDNGNKITAAQFKKLQKEWDQKLKPFNLSTGQLAKADLKTPSVSVPIEELEGKQDQLDEEEISDEEVLVGTRLDDNVPGDHFQEHAFDEDLDKPALEDDLAGSMDHAEMSGFHEVGERVYERKAPDWVFNDDKVQRVLQSRFPKLKTDATQRTNASRWNYVLYQYWRALTPVEEIAEHFGMTKPAVEEMVRRIRKAGTAMFG
jgi:hypothetical protein